MKTRRIAPGLYEIETARGTVTVEQQDSGLWYITWPGQPYPDDIEPTLRDAKQAARAFEEDA